MYDASFSRPPFPGPGSRRSGSVFLLIVVLALLPGEPRAHALIPDTHASAQPAISPPEQPSSGPGGRDYRFEDVAAFHVGDSPAGAGIFAPDETTNVDRQNMPIVVFLHGFGATDPVTYQDWIDHLVRRGTVVIYPDYQDPGFLGRGQEAYLRNMFAGVGEALALLGASPDRVHVVGHSLGGVLTAAYGALAPAVDLPPASTLTIIEPGGCRNCGGQNAFGIPLPLSRQISPDTQVRTVVGGDDSFVGDADARSIQQMLGDIPAGQKAFESIRSDDHGSPPLVADHLFPQTGRSGGETDALDWFGLWRPLDALMNCADRGLECDIALGERDDHVPMGLWSDGTPVLPPDQVR